VEIQLRNSLPCGKSIEQARERQSNKFSVLMNTRTLISFIALLAHGSLSVAAEPMYVWTQAPSEARDQEWVAENAQRLALQYPRSVETWAAQKDLEITFVVTSRTDFVPGACDEIPIRVTFKQNRAVSIDPLSTTQSCDRKIVEKLSLTEQLLLTPDSMFKRIGESVRSMKSTGSNCIQAEFDAVTGIPTKLVGGCPGRPDDGWRTVVSEIRRKSMHSNESRERTRGR
jgi:hypothetical protein